MKTLELIQLFQGVIGQVQAGGACHSPNPFELALIVALIGGIGVFSVASGIAIVSIANTIVALLIAGASIGAVVEAILGHAAAAKPRFSYPNASPFHKPLAGRSIREDNSGIDS